MIVLLTASMHARIRRCMYLALAYTHFDAARIVRVLSRQHVMSQVRNSGDVSLASRDDIESVIALAIVSCSV